MAHQTATAAAYANGYRGYTVDLGISVPMVTEVCYSCGVLFAMTAAHKAALVKDRDLWFYCPNGHAQHYLGESETTKLERRLANAQEGERIAWSVANLAQEEEKAARRRLAAAKGQLTKLRKRIANGVCPCCTRSFSNVHRHITSQHPEWAAEHTEALS